MTNLLRNLLGILLLPLTMAAGEKLIYHEIQTDAQGQIVPWFDTDPGKSYDHVSCRAAPSRSSITAIVRSQATR